jgi:hypothetical protein
MTKQVSPKPVRFYPVTPRSKRRSSLPAAMATNARSPRIFWVAKRIIGKPIGLYLAILYVSLVLSSSSSFSQTVRATLTGNVTDTSGAAVANAEVTVTESDQGVQRTVKTNSVGAYTLPELSPGSYEIKVESSGFKTIIRSGINLQVEQVDRQNFTLDVGSVSENVQVNAYGVPLNTDDSVVGQVIQNKEIVGLPLNGRNYLQLSLLTVGVAPANGSRTGATGAFSALGQHGSQTSVILDGIDNSSRSSGGELGYQAQIVAPSVDAVQEFKVVTDNNSAEYGFRLGGTVIVSTKTGTNAFHGALFEFLRNDKLDAANYFSAGQTKPAYHRNEFGGVLGGPILRNRTFFFVGYDGTRSSQVNPSISTVPLPAELQGNFSGQNTIFDPTTTTTVNGKLKRTAFVKNAIDPSRFDSVAKALIPLIPAPNLPGSTNNYYFAGATTDTPFEVDSRVDHTFSGKNRAFARYSHHGESTQSAGPLPLPADGAAWTTLDLSADSAVADLNTTLSPTIFNDATVGYSALNTVLGIPAAENENAKYGLTGLSNFGPYNQTGLTAITFKGFASLGSKTSNPNANTLGIAQASDKLFILRGRHTMVTGFTFIREQVYRKTAKSARGGLTFDGSYTQDPSNRSATGNAIADFLLGDVQTLQVSNLAGERVTARNYSAYFQDNWHVNDVLTLNLGVRWDMFGPPSYGRSQVNTFLFTPGSQTYQIVTPQSGSDCGCDHEWKNFAPRLGFAWQPYHGTVVRSGFGIVYGEPDGIQDSTGRFFNQAPVFDAVKLTGDKAMAPAATLSNGYPTINYASATVPQFVGVSVSTRSMPTQYAMQMFADVQQQLGSQAVLKLSYIGSRTRHLIIPINQNQPDPGPGTTNSRSPYPFFNAIQLTDPVGNASYDALTAKLERRFANGFMLLGSYTWSHAIDNDVENLNSTTGEGVQNYHDLDAERGNSVFDLRNYFITSAIYDLPFGRGKHFLNRNRLADVLVGNWQLAAIASFYSGTPFTPFLSTDIANTGNTNRPNRVGSGLLPAGQRSVSNWFDVSAFTIPANYTYGNSGRNILAGPGTRNVDLKIGRDFPITDTVGLQFRSEMFNALNTPNFGTPDGEVDLPQGPQITTAKAARQIQFGLKLVF